MSEPIAPAPSMSIFRGRCRPPGFVVGGLVVMWLLGDVVRGGVGVFCSGVVFGYLNRW